MNYEELKRNCEESYKQGIKDFRDKLLKSYQQYPVDSALDNDGYYPYEEACEDLENFIKDVADKMMEEKEMNNELKPCPFCGSKDIRIWNISTPWVQCYDCLASTACGNTQQEAIKIWNRRADNGKAD